MKNNKSSIILLLFIGLIITSCDDKKDDTEPITDLSVATVSSAPTLDGVGNDAVWNEADALELTLGQTADYANAFGAVDLTLKAVRTSSTLYILAKWTDPSGTENKDKKLWSFSNSEWSQSGNEDRIYFMFDTGNNGDEGANCASMCHVADGKMWTTGGGRADVWHWKAARTNPIGLADDKYFDGNYTDADGSISKDGGRHGDSKTISAYKDNKTSSGNYPKYAGNITSGSFIISQAGKAGSFSDLISFDSTDVNLQSNSYPGYYLDATAFGSGESRHDVEASGNYSGGVWTVELQRALDTGNDDDVAFTIGSSVQMTVAVTDNSGGDHSGAAPFLIKF